MASATRIATAGFTLIRQRPRAVLAWGFVYLAFAAVMSALTRPLMKRMLLSIPPDGVPKAGASFDAEAFWTIVLGNMGIYAALLVLLAAAMRAMVKPEEQGAFFIRVGMDELRLLGTILLVILILLAFYVVSLIVLGVIAAIGVFAATADGVMAASTGAHVGIVLSVLALILAEFAVLLILQMRLALSLPLTIMRGRIVMKEAWHRSKGHFWGLLGGFFLNGLIIAAVGVATMIPLLITLFSQGDSLMALADPRRQLAMMDSPLIYPMWLLMPLFGGFMIAMLGGALGTALIETEQAS